MRTASIILLALIATAPSTALGQADEASRLLDEGNLHFREGDFDQARAAYEQALSLGLESGTAYYNLGNAYFRLDRLGKAMLSYQRAARFFPQDTELAHNMDLVRSRARDQLSVLPRPVWIKWWNSFVDTVGIRLLFWLGALAWTGGMALAGRNMMTESRSETANRLALTLIISGLLAGSGAVAASVARSDNVSAVVTSSRADVLEEPSTSSRTVIVVHEALVVDVLSSGDQWVRIRLPNGVSGFVEQETIETI